MKFQKTRRGCGARHIAALAILALSLATLPCVVFTQVEIVKVPDFESVKTLYDEGKYQESLDGALKIMSLDKESALGHVLAGDALLAMDKSEEAINHYKKAVELEPSNYPGLMGIGSIYYESGNLEEAKKFFLSAIQSNPNSGEPYNYAAHVFREQGDLEKSIELLMQAVAVDPGFQEAYLNLGTVYVLKNEYIKAVDILNRSLEIDPLSYTAYNNLSLAYYRMGQYNNALEAIQNAIKLSPGDQKVMKNLSYLASEIEKINPAYLKPAETAGAESAAKPVDSTVSAEVAPASEANSEKAAPAWSLSSAEETPEKWPIYWEEGQDGAPAKPEKTGPAEPPAEPPVAAPVAEVSEKKKIELSPEESVMPAISASAIVGPDQSAEKTPESEKKIETPAPPAPHDLIAAVPNEETKNAVVANKESKNKEAGAQNSPELKGKTAPKSQIVPKKEAPAKTVNQKKKTVSEKSIPSPASSAPKATSPVATSAPTPTTTAPAPEIVANKKLADDRFIPFKSPKMSKKLSLEKVDLPPMEGGLNPLPLPQNGISGGGMGMFAPDMPSTDGIPIEELMKLRKSVPGIFYFQDGERMLWRYQPSTQASQMMFKGSMPSCSQDGSRLLYVTWDRESIKLYLYDVAASMRTIIHTSQDIIKDPKFSPNGKYVAFQSVSSNFKNTLKIISLADLNVKKMNSDIAVDSFSWSPVEDSIMIPDSSCGDGFEQNIPQVCYFEWNIVTNTVSKKSAALTKEAGSSFNLTGRKALEYLPVRKRLAVTPLVDGYNDFYLVDIGNGSIEKKDITKPSGGKFRLRNLTFGYDTDGYVWTNMGSAWIYQGGGQKSFPIIYGHFVDTNVAWCPLPKKAAATATPKKTGSAKKK